jgi:cytoskeletal protein RodZ
MNTKILMGGAAGIAGLLWWMNRQTASTPVPTVTHSASSIGSAVSGLTASKPIQITLKVPDNTAKSPAPTPQPPATNPAATSSGFAIGGGPANNSTKPDSGYFGALGTPINDPTEVGRLDSIKAFINTQDWGTNKAASVAALREAQAKFGVTDQEVAVASGYKLEDIRAL